MRFVQTRLRLVQAGAALAAAALVAGCGNHLPAVITPSNPSGPSSQPQSYAVVVSAPSSSTPGVATIIDYSGDSIMAEADIGPGPTTLALNYLGFSAFTLNSDGTLTNFPVSASLQEKQIAYTTVPSTAEPVNLFIASTGLWAADLCAFDPTSAGCAWDTNPLTQDFSGADVFVSSPETFLKSIPLPPTPVTLAGSGGFSQRAFGISQGNTSNTSSNGLSNNIASAMACNTSPRTVGVNGEADGIEISSYTISSYLPLRRLPGLRGHEL